jgi:hypothetical protein
LKALRRRVAEDWLDGQGKETALSVLDELVFEAGRESPLNWTRSAWELLRGALVLTYPDPGMGIRHGRH